MYFAQFMCIDTKLFDPVEPEDIDVQEPSELDSILNEVFSVDPVSGFPKGDLAYYLSKDGNPMVKDWLEKNLLMPRASKGQSLEGVTDDLLAEMQRGSNESIEDYSLRLRGIYDDSVKIIEDLKNKNQNK